MPAPDVAGAAHVFMAARDEVTGLSIGYEIVCMSDIDDGPPGQRRRMSSR